MTSPGEPLDQQVGYVLKQAQAALNRAMDARLRPLGLSVPQYACLELLARSPGLSSADLARGAFVTRQSMGTVLQGLERAGLVVRPSAPPQGRTLPARLTEAGEELLAQASADVRGVQERMLAPLDEPALERLRSDLAACAAALETDEADGAAPRRGS